MGDMAEDRPEQHQEVDAWNQRSWIWHAFLGVSLVGSAAILWSSQATLPTWSWVLFAALPVWHWIGLWLSYQNLASWEERQWARIVVVAGDILIWFLLVRVSAAFYFILFGLYSQIFRNLKIRYAAAAAGTITVLVVVQETVGRWGTFDLANPVVWIFAVTGAAGIILGVYIASIVRQSGERKELIDRLEVAQAELSDAVRREAVLEERQRLAREIHDTLAQGFTSIVIHLETALAEMDQQSNRAGLERVERAVETARRSLDEARRVVRALRPDILETTSLAEAIRRSSSRWASEHDLQVSFRVAGTLRDLGGDREIVLFRAAEESLANVLKHAAATRVEIDLAYGDDLVSLTVLDDGRGIEEQAESTPSGFGLRGMRERAEAVGGTLSVTGRDGAGTSVLVSLPTVEHL